MKEAQVKVRVPATTANLGPGFDCMGIALKLYNEVTIKRVSSQQILNPMIQESISLFFRTIEKKSFPLTISIKGEVPIARGLGSSVTLRAGVIAGLNRLAGEPLSQAECLNLVIQLEGHPDNAAPAFLGGFTVATEETILRTPVDPRLKFIAIIPDLEVETEKARHVLPKAIRFKEAVDNSKHAALIAAAFASHKYELLEDAFKDYLHQPYRRKLVPFLEKTIAMGKEAGALGGFLSGSGSTIICLNLNSNSHSIVKNMRAVLKQLSYSNVVKILMADNEGIKIFNY